MERGSNLSGTATTRPWLLGGLGLLAFATCGGSVQSQPRAVVPGLSNSGCGSVADFYQAAPGTRLWAGSGKLGREARVLRAYLPREAGSSRTGERELSQALVRRADALAAPPDGNIRYVDEAVRPQRPCASTVLEQAAAAGSLAAYLDRIEAPNDLARAIRGSARTNTGAAGEGERDLALARSIGAPPRALVVDTGSARLWLLENGRVADSMKVVVGKAGSETPLMAGRISYATLNPYWNVPPDLVRNKIAPRVASQGPGYLARQGYQVVDRYGSGARGIAPRTVNWMDVAAGRRKVGIRQVPSPANMMGAVKFIFPNDFGVYLHDTPGRWAFARDDRRLSNGCVRVERAADLYRWLFGRPLPARAAVGPEYRDALPAPVPVYLFDFSAKGSAAMARLGRGSAELSGGRGRSPVLP